jgi:hypothetical protein
MSPASRYVTAGMREGAGVEDGTPAGVRVEVGGEVCVGAGGLTAPEEATAARVAADLGAGD